MIFEILGLLFSIILGTVGHFLYDFTNKNRLIGFFFATNESTFEHIKLGITPIILWMIVEFFTFNYKCLFFAKFISIIVFTICLLILYYGYKFISNKNILFLDISIFYISLALAYYCSIKLLSCSNCGILLNLFGFLGIIFILLIYKKNFDKNL